MDNSSSCKVKLSKPNTTTSKLCIQRDPVDIKVLGLRPLSLVAMCLTVSKGRLCCSRLIGLSISLLAKVGRPNRHSTWAFSDTDEMEAARRGGGGDIRDRGGGLWDIHWTKAERTKSLHDHIRDNGWQVCMKKFKRFFNGALCRSEKFDGIREYVL